jgi:hypothetical protein
MFDCTSSDEGARASVTVVYRGPVEPRMISLARGIPGYLYEYTSARPILHALARQMPSRPDPLDPEHLATPYLTVAVNLCTALGVFIGAWVLIYLRSARHVQRGPQSRQVS